MVEKDTVIAFVLGFMFVAVVFTMMHDRHYQSRGNRILLNRVQTLEEIVSEWTN